MRAREFVINVPITISINGDGDPEVGVGDQDQEEELTPIGDEDKLMVPPLQQDLEMRKTALGKQSYVSDQILDPDGNGPMAPPSDARRAGVANNEDILDNVGVGVFEGK